MSTPWVVPLSSGGLMHLTRCQSCMSGYHYDEPTWHSWADEDDVAHALETGQRDPSDQACACFCVKEKA